MLQRLFRTIIHLRSDQIAYQVLYRAWKPALCECKSIADNHHVSFNNYIHKHSCCQDNTLTFLNLSSTFTIWNDTQYGMLWAYNLNYMDWLLQPDMEFEVGAMWIDKFIGELPSNKVGLDPYPIALRSINWIKFIANNYEKISAEKLEIWNNSLYSQCKLLERKLEYHLLGNHLLEDAYSLYIASIYFQDKPLFKRSSKLLLKELREQTLSDGAHYELSPMYHSILLDRLLDCYNISTNNIFFEAQTTVNAELKLFCQQATGHLKSIVYSDLSIPLFNDSANGIAPSAQEIISYAERLGIESGAIKLSECGYRKLNNKNFEAFVDVGDVKASYQAGHTHADTFNYELRVDGVQFIIDSGISTYEKNDRRQYERSTKAHNTVSINGLDSSEVWGGFRVARRAKVSILSDSDSYVEASHNGFGAKHIHNRQFVISDDYFSVTDCVSGKASAVSYIHFSPDTLVELADTKVIKTSRGSIKIEGATKIEISECLVSSEYNTFNKSKVAVIHFDKRLQYIIQK